MASRRGAGDASVGGAGGRRALVEGSAEATTLEEAGVVETAAAIRSGTVRVRELVERRLACIDRLVRDPAGRRPSAPTPAAPLARRTRDVAVLFSVMAGAGAPEAVYRPLLADRPRAVASMRVGVANDGYFRDVSAEVAAALARTQEVLRDLGVDVRRLRLPDPRAR